MLTNNFTKSHALQYVNTEYKTIQDHTHLSHECKNNGTYNLLQNIFIKYFHIIKWNDTSLFIFNIHYKQHCLQPSVVQEWTGGKHASEQYECSIIYMKIKTNYAQVLATPQSSFHNCPRSCTTNMPTMLHVHYSEL